MNVDFFSPHSCNFTSESMNCSGGILTAEWAHYHLMLLLSWSTLFIYPSQLMGMEKSQSTFPPPLSFKFLLSSPREDHCLGRNSKYSWMLDGISEMRYEGAGVGKRLFPLYPIWQTCPHAHEHTYTHTFFCLEHFLSLLQKGESGQKSRSLITLSSNIILIFRCCKGELWKRNATAEMKWDDEWKMKDKMKWMKYTEGKGKEYEKEKEHGGGGQWREKVHKSMLVFMLWIILQF